MFKRKGTVASLRAAKPQELRLLSHPDAGDLESLIGALRRQAFAEPADASWPFLLGYVLMAWGDAAEARDELEAAVVLDPHDPRITLHLAFWYELALHARRGRPLRLELPPYGDRTLHARADGYADIDPASSPAEIAARAIELFDQTVRFRLPKEDIALVRDHVTVVREISAIERTHGFASRLLRPI